MPIKATDLLKKQHRKVEQLFKALEKGKGDPQATLQELANDLAAHMAIEQTIFYPSIREADETLIAESFEEHAIAELEMKRLLNTDPADESLFKARVVCLKEIIQHHVSEEEEELFPKVEKMFEEGSLKELGGLLKQRFDEAIEEGYAALIPSSMSKASADNRRLREARPAQ